MEDFIKIRDIFIDHFSTWKKSVGFTSNDLPSDPEGRLKLIFKEILEKKSNEYDLCGKNVYGDVYYFDLASRVKSSRSLKEKILRSDFGLKVGSLLVEEKESIDATKFDKFIRDNLDDLIGIRIITWFIQDSCSMIDLLKDSLAEFSAKGITLLGLNEQPKKMKNGFEIFRIQGIFEKLPFELQIKSRLEDAWAELEHTQFYKNPIITREREVFKNVLGNNFEILMKVDNALYFIREGSSKNGLIQENNEREKILTDINNALFKNLNYNIDLIKFYPYLKNNKISNVEDLNIEVTPLKTLFSTANYYYLQERGRNWDLVLYESFYNAYSSDKTYSGFIKSIVETFILLQNSKDKLKVGNVKNAIIASFLEHYFVNYWYLGSDPKWEEEASLASLESFDILNSFLLSKFEIFSFEIEEIPNWPSEVSKIFFNCMLIFVFNRFDIFDNELEELKKVTEEILSNYDGKNLDKFFTEDAKMTWASSLLAIIQKV